MRFLRLIGCSLVLFCTFNFSQANILSVTSLADAGPGSLREAIELAERGDTLQITQAGTILLDSQLVISDTISIFGLRADQTILDGQDTTRIMFVDIGGKVCLRNMTFQHGSAIYYFPFKDGGAIKIYGAATLDSCILQHNQGGFGGAIRVGRDQLVTALTLTDCALIHNAASFEGNLFDDVEKAGGAIYIEGQDNGVTSVRINNCTISNNFADRSGAGIFAIGDIIGGTDCFINNSTIAYNESRSAGGIYNIRFANVRLRNSLVAYNEGLDFPDVRGDMTSSGYCLFGTATIDDQNLDTVSTDIVGVDALVAPLGYYESIFPTHPLACGSPAIDAGSFNANFPLDLRGQARIGTPDIGSHEQNNDIDNRILNLNDNGFGSLRQAIFLACDGDTLELGDLVGDIVLESTLVLEKSLTLIGNKSRNTRFDGNRTHRIMEVAAGAQVAVSWMGFMRGQPELYGGGAIQNRGDLTIAHCSFSDNIAQAGGAIANYAIDGPASLSILNSTFARNRATALDGGGIDNRSFDFPATASLNFCTLVDNRAAERGGAISHALSDIGSVSLHNTLIGNNRAFDGRDMWGSATSQGHNLIENIAGMEMTLAETDLHDVNPGVDTYDYYGGTLYSVRLQPESPAIDAGDATVAPDVDQRGAARIIGAAPDIGAYEYDPLTHTAFVTESNALRLFPNPARTAVHVEHETETVVSVQLLNMLGTVVPFTPTYEGQRVSLSIANLSAGIYYVRIQLADGQRHTQLVEILP